MSFPQTKRIKIEQIRLFDALPMELVYYIINFLEANNLVRFSLCNKALYSLVNQQHVWYPLLQKDFPNHKLISLKNYRKRRDDARFYRVQYGLQLSIINNFRKR